MSQEAWSIREHVIANRKRAKRAHKLINNASLRLGFQLWLLMHKLGVIASDQGSTGLPQQLLSPLASEWFPPSLQQQRLRAAPPNQREPVSPRESMVPRAGRAERHVSTWSASHFGGVVPGAVRAFPDWPRTDRAGPPSRISTPSGNMDKITQRFEYDCGTQLVATFNAMQAVDSNSILCPRMRTALIDDRSAYYNGIAEQLRDDVTQSRQADAWRTLKYACPKINKKVVLAQFRQCLMCRATLLQLMLKFVLSSTTTSRKSKQQLNMCPQTFSRKP